MLLCINAQNCPSVFDSVTVVMNLKLKAIVFSMENGLTNQLAILG